MGQQAQEGPVYEWNQRTSHEEIPLSSCSPIGENTREEERGRRNKGRQGWSNEDRREGRGNEEEGGIVKRRVEW